MDIQTVWKFFHFDGPLNFWAILNSQFFTTAVVGVVTVYFAHLAQTFKEKAEDEEEVARLLQEQLERNEEAADLEPPEVRQPAGEDHFEPAAAVIDRLKKLVDDKVAGLKDGRNRRKYQTIGRRDYRLRVAALQGDGGLTEEETALLANAFAMWRPYQTNRRPTPIGVLNELRALAARLGVQA